MELLKVRCNPLAIGAALVEDGHLVVGPRERYTSIGSWWNIVSTQTLSRYVGPSVGLVLDDVCKKGGFSLEHVTFK
jgi:hypothetical protein